MEPTSREPAERPDDRPSVVRPRRPLSSYPVVTPPSTRRTRSIWSARPVQVAIGGFVLLGLFVGGQALWPRDSGASPTASAASATSQARQQAQPTVAPVPTPRSYSVKQGDTLLAIATEFDISLEALQAANPGVDPRTLQIGQTLTIPSPGAVNTPAPAASPQPPAGPGGSSTPQNQALPRPTQPAAGGGAAVQVDGNQLLAPVNKQNYLAPGFVPGDLVDAPVPVAVREGIRVRAEVLQAATDMINEARKENLHISLVSGFRSYQEQDGLYNGYVRQMGQAQASRISALPGHSEHQLGTAIDFSSPSNNFALSERFGATPEGRWMADNAVRFGFLLSYPADKEQETGYAFEPWHYRYVGQPTAAQVKATGLTLTEYLRGR